MEISILFYNIILLYSKTKMFIHTTHTCTLVHVHVQYMYMCMCQVFSFIFLLLKIPQLHVQVQVCVASLCSAAAVSRLFVQYLPNNLESCCYMTRPTGHVLHVYIHGLVYRKCLNTPI